MGLYQKKRKQKIKFFVKIDYILNKMSNQLINYLSLNSKLLSEKIYSTFLILLIELLNQ